MMRWSKPRLAPSRLGSVGALVAACLLVTACGGGSSGQEAGGIAADYDLGAPQQGERGGADTTRFVVGSKDFAEQEILGQITLQSLRAAGAEVVDRTSLGSSEAVRAALVAEQIDMYWEYTGTGALVHLALSDPPADPDRLFAAVSELDRERYEVAWLPPAPANNTYALAVRSSAIDPDSEDFDEQLAGVTTISDLRQLLRTSPRKATVCVGPEFRERADGLPGLSEHYGLRFPRTAVKVLPDLTVYTAVAEGELCNFGSVFATSGYIPDLKLVLLKDDKVFFPAYNPALTLRVETLERYPDLKPLLQDIAGRLDTDALRTLSGEVLVDGRSPEDVAQQWLRDEGLIS